MGAIHYRLVDVFAEELFGGNPLAVFRAVDGLSAERMQQIARELNLSETVFVLPPTAERADHRLRIFTPAIELPMAGHPTVGAAFVLAENAASPGDAPRVLRLEEGVGVLRVEVRFRAGRPDLVLMEQPPASFGAPAADRATLARLLGLAESDLDPTLPAETGSTGVPFHLIPVRDAAALAAARLDPAAWSERLAGSSAPHVYLFRRAPESPSELFSRMFAPAMGIPEDPATGAAAGPLAAYAVRHWLADANAGASTAEITIRQGVEMGRPSLLEARIGHSAGRVTGIRIGGRCRAVGAGRLELPG